MGAHPSAHGLRPRRTPGARGAARLLLLAMLAFSAACLVRVRQVVVEPLDPDPQPLVVRSPVRVHLLDGSTLVYPDGLTVAGDTLWGEGERYDLRLKHAGPATRVLLDSVAGLESYREGTNLPATVALSIPASVLGVGGSLALYKAVFGSCPTIYADSAGTAALQAEGFSYSIAPLFEARDVDLLRVPVGAGGVVQLEVRNEALETHFINHMEVLEVPHAPDEVVVPDARGHPLALRGVRPATAATDRAGRDLRATLRDADGAVFATDSARLAAANAADAGDHLDFAVPVAPGTDSVAVALRLRNSLLTTVLLYDLMLAASGARALDWLGEELQQVDGAVGLARWYAGRMGLRVAVREGGVYREVARVTDTGPIAWKDVAVVVPVPAGDTLHVRLSFVADAWRIDRVGFAAGVRRPVARRAAVREVVTADGVAQPQALAHLRAPDESYLETTPGQRFFVRFATDSSGAGGPRTLLLASQGYYSEWIRQDWVRTARSDTPFRGTDEALGLAIARWRTRQAQLEDEFFRTRIPVR